MQKTALAHDQRPSAPTAEWDPAAFNKQRRPGNITPPISCNVQIQVNSQWGSSEAQSRPERQGRELFQVVESIFGRFFSENSVNSNETRTLHKRSQSLDASSEASASSASSSETSTPTQAISISPGNGDRNHQRDENRPANDQKELFESILNKVQDPATARIILAISETATEMALEGDALLAKNVPQSQSPAPEMGFMGSSRMRASITSEFNGAKKPKIPLVRYLSHIAYYLNSFHKQAPGPDSVGIRTLLIATLYIDRLRVFNPQFVLNSFNIHRVFLTATLVAVKYLEDEPPSNGYVANLGGIDLKQMNYLEEKFCSGMRFSLYTSFDDLKEAYALFDPDMPHTPAAPMGL